MTSIRRRPKRIDVASFVIHLLLLLLAALIVLPFVWMAVSSTLDLPQIMQYPPRFMPGTRLLKNLADLFSILPFLRAFLNSLVVAAAVTASQLFLCSLAGYGFAKYDLPGREKLFTLLLATMMIPSAVGLVPWYIMMSWFGWIDSYKALIIPGMANAFGIFWMRQFISQSVPDEMIQAARIDGCGDFGIYARIVLPVILPGLGALGIICYMGAWNDYLGPMIILRTISKYTLPLCLALMQNQFNNRVHLMMAGSTLAVVPVLLMFFLASQRFIKGLTAGAIKG